MFLAIGIILVLISIGGYFFAYIQDKKLAWPASALITILGIICIVFYFNTAAGERTLKSWKSANGNGINRTVEVYDQAGHLIKTYKGKLDVQNNDYGNKVLFDLDGKRTIIYNATVIVQEN